MGGRGASSLGSMGGGFTSAGMGGEKALQGVLFPATFNTQGRFATQDAAVKLFTEKYGGADREYGISVDDQGFVHRHVMGGSSAVAISAAGRDHLIVHNHPRGGAFSKADLVSLAHDRRASGIVATSSKATYKITKTKSFDANKFQAAVRKAKWPAKYDYDKGADWWLRKNEKTLGYKYTKS